jgi:2-polyprenyl-3-methyl-5-hydroxy-6-metoxy-1,4-benzoquinol methylase
MTIPLDQARIDAFGQKMVETLNHAGLALMISIGHRNGLFEVLSRLPAATSEQIAVEAGQNERYVREWLGAMVTGGVVEYRPEDRTYHLPAEHASWLTRASSPNNVAASMQWVAVLGHVEDHVLDVGCGSGRAVNEMAASSPQSRFTGYDAAEEGIAAANAEAARRGLTNVRFEEQDVAVMGARAVFDLITAFDSIHDQARPDAVLRNIASALAPNGTFLMQDISGSSHVHTDIEHPYRDIPVHNLLYALHVGLARGGRAGARCDVGQGEGDRDATRGRFRAGACRDAAARSDELLLHRHAELVIRLGADHESTTKPTELHPSVDRNGARDFLPSSHYSLSCR